MNQQPLGKTGFPVSPLGFGAAPIGFLKTDQDQVAALLNHLLDAGVNLIDTAAAYQGSEELIARAVGHRRDEFVLVSKCGNKVPDLDAPEWSADLVTQTVDRSLRRLKVDSLDVMLLHSCDLKTLREGEALGALVKARDAGKIKFVGYSGDNEAAAHAATLADIAVIETSVNVADQANLDLVLPAARQNCVGVLAKRPIANAAWKATGDQPGFYGSYAQTYHDRLKAMALDPASLGLAGSAAGISAEELWPEIALRFTLSQPGVTTAIIGTTNLANARRNIEYAEKGPLPAAVVEKVRQAFKKAESAAGAKWTGQT